MAVAGRDDVAAVLLAPQVAYGTCADEAMWARATEAGGAALPAEWSMAKCREVGDVPCSAMALVSGLGVSVTWRQLPLKSKDWLPRPAGSSRPPADDFCLKRPKFTNETSLGENGANPDELGMAC